MKGMGHVGELDWLHLTVAQIDPAALALLLLVIETAGWLAIVTVLVVEYLSATLHSMGLIMVSTLIELVCPTIRADEREETSMIN